MVVGKVLVVGLVCRQVQAIILAEAQEQITIQQQEVAVLAQQEHHHLVEFVALVEVEYH